MVGILQMCGHDVSNIRVIKPSNINTLKVDFVQSNLQEKPLHLPPFFLNNRYEASVIQALY